MAVDSVPKPAPEPRPMPTSSTPRSPATRDLGMKATLLFPTREIAQDYYLPLIYTACRTCYSELEPQALSARPTIAALAVRVIAGERCLVIGKDSFHTCSCTGCVQNAGLHWVCAKCWSALDVCKMMNLHLWVHPPTKGSQTR